MATIDIYLLIIKITNFQGDLSDVSTIRVTQVVYHANIVSIINGIVIFVMLTSTSVAVPDLIFA